MSVKLEILNASYWEHYKYAKDMSLYLPLHHPKRVKIEKELNSMIAKIHALQNQENN